jgi:hypothetical protein
MSTNNSTRAYRPHTSTAPERVELAVIAEHGLDISGPYNPFRGLPPASAAAPLACPLCGTVLEVA